MTAQPTSQAAADAGAGATPAEQTVPPRHWGLGQLTRGAAALVVLMPLIHWGWTVHARGRLNAEIARLRAQGEPVLLEDFQPPTVAERDNAATYYALAADYDWKLAPGYTTVEDVSLLWFFWGNEAFEHFPEILDGFVLNNADGLCLIRSGRHSLNGAWPGPRPTSPLILAVARSLPPLQLLWRAVRTAVRVHALRGNIDEAVESALDGLALARGRFGEDSILGLLAQASREQTVAESLGTLIPRVEAIDRAAARRLLEELLREPPHQLQIERCVYGERLVMLDTIQQEVDGKHPPGPRLHTLERLVTIVARPVLYYDATGMLKEYSEFTADLRSGPSMAQLGSRLGERGATGLRALVRSYSRELASFADHAIELAHRARAVRRMAAIALALRLYELDHGERPERLESLVPSYLPTVPSDPHHPAGGPFGYVRSSRGARLYSIGANQVAEGGRNWLRTDRPMIDLNHGDTPVFFLDRYPPVNEELRLFANPQQLIADTQPASVEEQAASP